jgi:hypothetical protein
MLLPSSDDCVALAAVILIALLHRQICRHGSFLLVVSNLPSTIMHELAHFVVALLLGGHPTGFSIWPSRHHNRWQLGSVTARLTTLSALPTALAPLFWLPAGYALFLHRHSLGGDSLQLMSTIYLAVYLCLSAAIPSWQDLKVALSHPLSMLLWGVIITVARFITA